MPCVKVYGVTLKITFKKSSGFMVAVDVNLYSWLIHRSLHEISH
jgi:hypothetical protein